MNQSIDIYREFSLRRKRRFAFVLIVCLVVFGHFAINISSAQFEGISEQAESLVELARSEGRYILASDELVKLRVADRAPKDGYRRDKFGKVWDEYYGCDVRNIILQRDLQNTIIDDNKCTVLEGILVQDPFTGETIHFKKGEGNAIHIEHIVALSDAWQKGAQNINIDRREVFANDPLNLIAVDGKANMAKGDADASEWLPIESYQCMYVARQVAIKSKYDLWVTSSEKRAIKKVLDSCPEQLLPIDLSEFKKYEP